MNITDLYDSPKSLILLVIDFCIIFSGLGIVFSKKIIYSALYLGLVFISIAFLYLYLNADFIAAIQILIYVGAINVIILFAIMLVNKPEFEKTQSIGITELFAGIMTSFFFLLLSFNILNTQWSNINQINIQTDLSSSMNNKVEFIGVSLLTDYLLPFELLSVILLVALIGAINIARKDESLDIKS